MNREPDGAQLKHFDGTGHQAVENRWDQWATSARRWGEGRRRVRRSKARTTRGWITRAGAARPEVLSNARPFGSQGELHSGQKSFDRSGAVCHNAIVV
ncbi:MAG: hypothetical protein Kow0059_22960 [Candidatus Sumerlaeia bacterium]